MFLCNHVTKIELSAIRVSKMLFKRRVGETVWFFFFCLLQSSVGTTHPGDSPSFPSTGPYGSYNQTPGPSYSQFGSTPLAGQQFGSTGAGTYQLYLILSSFTRHEFQSFFYEVMAFT